MNPLLHTLQQYKGGMHILNHIEPATVYADDVTIFLNSSQGVTPVTRALTEFSHASGAHLNTNKSKALPLGEWDTLVNMKDWSYFAVPGDLRQRCISNIIYRTFLQHRRIEPHQEQMRATRKYPQVNWEQTWENLAAHFLPATVHSEWCRVVHDIINTNER
jgi:hypothetical protein